MVAGGGSCRRSTFPPLAHGNDKAERARVGRRGELAGNVGGDAFTAEFVEGVRQGRYPVREGVVAKGIALGKKPNPQHGLWMAKVKTRWWLAEGRRRAAESDVFRQALEENLREQGCGAA
jgi:hypothetical protein